ncbi:hypothetical protein K1W54_21780 [Micromonospora sp. CPCC 205371]|nr:hypothetical protein [Micromonospora sp. CPCC 205371]
MTRTDRSGTSPRQQRIAQTLAVRRRTRQRRRAIRWLGAAVIVLAVASVAAFAVTRGGGHAAAAGNGRLGPEGIALQTGPPLAPVNGAASGATVDGISCDVSEQVAYHIHAHLAVFVNGASRQVPSGIGVVTPAVSTTDRGPFVQATRCYYWLHTHAADGIVHAESPTQRQYTLGDFFDIWRQPLSSTRVGPAVGTVSAYVNGAPYAGDPRGIVLDEHEDIQLDVGTPVVSSQPVDWTGSGL